MFVKEVMTSTTQDNKLTVERNIFYNNSYRIYPKDLDEKNNFYKFTANESNIQYKALKQVKNFINNYYHFHNYDKIEEDSLLNHPSLK